VREVREWIAAHVAGGFAILFAEIEGFPHSGSRNLSPPPGVAPPPVVRCHCWVQDCLGGRLASKITGCWSTLAYLTAIGCARC
jgi:hypothetical protein